MSRGRDILGSRFRPLLILHDLPIDIIRVDISIRVELSQAHDRGRHPLTPKSVFRLENLRLESTVFHLHPFSGLLVGSEFQFFLLYFLIQLFVYWLVSGPLGVGIDFWTESAAFQLLLGLYFLVF